MVTRPAWLLTTIAAQVVTSGTGLGDDTPKCAAIGLPDEQAGGLQGEETLRELLRQMLAALATVHAANVTHRDVKPENLLVRAPCFCRCLRPAPSV